MRIVLIDDYGEIYIHDNIIAFKFELGERNYLTVRIQYIGESKFTSVTALGKLNNVNEYENLKGKVMYALKQECPTLFVDINSVKGRIL